MDVLLTLGFDTSTLAQSYKNIQATLSGLSVSAPIFSQKQFGLVDQYGKSLSSVAKITEETGKVSIEAAGGFSKLLSRISIWSIAWTSAYAVVRQTIKEVQNFIDTSVALGEAINNVRLMADETSETFNQKYLKTQLELVKISSDGIISLRDLTDAFQILAREGISNDLLMRATRVVQTLSTIEKIDPKKIASIVAEIYQTFAPSLAGSEQAKLALVEELLTVAWQKGNISATDYYAALSKVGATADEVGVTIEDFTRLMIIADAQMLSGRRASMAIGGALSALSGDVSKLNTELGALIPATATPLERLREIDRITKNMSEAERRNVLEKIFGKGIALTYVSKLLKDVGSDISIISVETEKLPAKLKKVADDAHFVAKAFTAIRNAIIEQRVETQLVNELAAHTMILKSQAKTYAERQKIQKQHEIELAALYEQIRTLGAVGALEEKRAASIKKTADEYIIISQLGKNYVRELEDSLAISYLEAAGVDKRKVAEEGINRLIDRTAASKRASGKEEEVRTALQLARTQDIATAYDTITQALRSETEARKYLIELTKYQGDIIRENYAEIRALANDLQAATKNFLVDLMKGTGDVKDYIQSIVDAYREAFAEQLTVGIKATGIFEGMAEAFLSPMQKARKNMYDGIVEGSVRGSKMYYDAIVAASSGAAYTEGAAGGGGGGVTNLLSTLSSLFGKAKPGTAQVVGMGEVVTAPPDYYKSMEAQTDATKGATAAAKESSKAMAAVSQTIGAAAAVYGTYQTVMAYKGTGKPIEGAISGAMSGAMAGMMVGGPVGAVIGGVIGGVAGGILGGKGRTTVDIREQTIELRSAINLSTKELQLISRDMSAVRRGLEGMYIMPKSAYFMERLGIEERFAQSQGRSLM